ncbi:MAG TPA: class I SAM-dependent methyltransferase [Armatimonadota bacterium]|nr:class I SAM-dependent methyltransferase [Armatimonadota bacterium]
MSRAARALREKRFGDRPNDWQTYHALVSQHLGEGTVVLDVGCGTGLTHAFPWADHPGVRLTGIDPDPRAASNAHLDCFALLEDLNDWPVDDGSVDVTLARYVLEHVAEPQAFFANVRRVLRPGGVFIFLCPNKWRPLRVVGSVIPQALTHRFLTRAREADVFPTWHRANSARVLRRLARQFGFEVEHLTVREYAPPRWMDATLATALLGLGYHWTVTATRLDRLIGSSIIGVFRRP